MTRTLPSSPSGSGAQTIERAAKILRVLTSHNRHGIRLVDLHELTGLRRSTAHRILQALVAEELAYQNKKSKKYFLGPRAYEMGLAATPSINMRDLCRPYIREIAEHTADTVFLVVRSKFEGLCIDRFEGSYPIHVFVMDVGRRRPLNVGAANIAILSTLNNHEITRICEVNKNLIAQNYPNYSEKKLWTIIEAARKKGFVLNDILEVASARAVAVPIRLDNQQTANMAISVSAIAERLTGRRIEETVALLKNAAKSIQKEIAEFPIIPPLFNEE